MNNTRPTFGVQSVSTTSTNSVPNVTSNNTNGEQQFRKEIGAIWVQASHKSKEQFLSLRLKIPKDKLEQALASSNGEDVSINFVAFTNKTANEAPNRPAYRIYEERKK